MTGESGFSGGGLLGNGSGSQLVPGAGNFGKFGKINSASILGDCLSGNQDRFADFQGFGDFLEDRKVLLNSRRIFVLKGAVCKVLEGSVGPPRVSVAPRSEWSVSHKSLATGSKVRLGFSGRGDPGSLGLPSRDNLRWWCAEGRLEEGVSLALRSPDQIFWSNASDQGWGATVADHLVSGIWLGGRGSSLHQSVLVAGSGEGSQGSLLLASRSCDRSFLRQYDRGVVSEEARRDFGSGPQLCGAEDSALGGAGEHLPVATVCSGSEQVVADSLSHPNQVVGSEWILHQEVFDWLRKRWTVTIDLYASSLSHRCSVYFAPVSDPIAAGTDAMFQSWDSLQAYVFPPFAMIGQVLVKVRASQSLAMTLVTPFWPQRPWYPSCWSY